jgi:hypothetical protein
MEFPTSGLTNSFLFPRIPHKGIEFWSSSIATPLHPHHQGHVQRTREGGREGLTYGVVQGLMTRWLAMHKDDIIAYLDTYLTVYPISTPTT